MQVRLSDYFARLAEIGTLMQAEGADGMALDPSEALAQAVTLVTVAKRHRSRIMFVGNGGSAGIASHMATDWLKNGGYAATCFNDGSALTCIANDLGYERVFALQIERHCRNGDVLIAISSSGKSPNILEAVAAARRSGAAVITLSGFDAVNPLRKLGDLNFWVPDGHYGFVEISHLAICHAMLDVSMGALEAARESVDA
jgi:D-sedoheptulose 7-phosphate isomerase